MKLAHGDSVFFHKGMRGDMPSHLRIRSHLKRFHRTAIDEMIRSPCLRQGKRRRTVTDDSAIVFYVAGMHESLSLRKRLLWHQRLYIVCKARAFIVSIFCHSGSGADEDRIDTQCNKPVHRWRPDKRRKRNGQINLCEITGGVAAGT